jgi:predicted RNA binding protein YcfA (HicA-like mRNA interferase family)
LPKPPQVNARALRAALQRAGFVVRRQTGSHVILRHPHTGRMAVVPDHPGALSPELVAGILKQAEITPEELRELLR